MTISRFQRMMLGIAAASMAIGATPAAFAQQDTGEPDADARCTVALVALAQVVPEAQQPAFQAGVMYFVGKLIGRLGRDGAIAELRTTESTMDRSQFPDIAQQCAGELKDLGAILQGM
ncbi:hypothetical protein [Sphingosinithalassobacter portus]|uniref:hypothetical protein n=1 Tax=Stakelama portus TaxID=2676234 RepID=UPI0011AB40D0|nr:hypothetical protein [Sphingosinithalassobacter portus]